MAVHTLFGQNITKDNKTMFFHWMAPTQDIYGNWNDSMGKWISYFGEDKIDDDGMLDFWHFPPNLQFLASAKINVPSNLFIILGGHHPYILPGIQHGTGWDYSE